MDYSRRQIVIGAGALGLLPQVLSATKPVAMQIQFLGTKAAKPEDVKKALEIISRLPTDNYHKVMAALADLGHTEKPSSTGEPWNRRWREYANPLLVQIWRDMNVPVADDCTAWCGVTLGWCLKRAGWTPPPHCESSQSYLTYGSEVKNPLPGDICVFTNIGDKSHGHVTIFEHAVPASKSIHVLGANQSLSGPNNCPNGVSVNVVDARDMALKDARHFLNRYVRPPAQGGL